MHAPSQANVNHATLFIRLLLTDSVVIAAAVAL